MWNRHFEKQEYKELKEISDDSKHPIPFPAWGALCPPGAAEDGQGLAGLTLL